LLEAEQGLPVILWVVLIGGGIVVVSFTYLFGLDSTVIHLLMVAALALIISLVLFTVAALNFPFKGDITFSPDAMEQVLRRFENSKLSDLRQRVERGFNPSPTRAGQPVSTSACQLLVCLRPRG
jgi:hypothetical protein